MPNVHVPPDASEKAFGQRLQWARILVEPDRAEFARAIGVSLSTLHYLESGERSPSVPMLKIICHSLRITFEYLSDGDVRNVDPWMRARLLDAHPELARPRSRLRRGGRAGNNHEPRAQAASA